jgi:hypothetical protein
MEVVIPLTKSDESSNDMITRAVPVIERLFTEPVSQTVDAEGSLLNEEDSEDSTVDL